MILLPKGVGGPLGLEIAEPIVRRFVNRDAAIAVGELAAVDMDLSDTLTTNHKFGSSSAGASNVVALDAAHLTDGVATIAMALEALAHDEEGLFLLYGIPPVGPITVNDGGANNNAETADKLFAIAAQQVADVNQGATGRVVGHVLITAQTDVSALPIPVFFNGISWLGKQ